MFDGFYSKVTRAPEFPPNFDWINSDEPLLLERLKGHIVVLDFWTYCCINCMHTLPVLAELEKKYEGKPVVFIGIHSAKFFNEQDKNNIEQAVRRYEITHPVLVDRKMTIWQKFDVAGWPTIVIIDPQGIVIYKQSGEGQREAIEDTIEVLLEKHGRNGTLSKVPARVKHKVHDDETILSYPGKVAISEDRIAISDSNHNRIIITDMSGKILHVVGNGRKGFSDGRFENALFYRPQGLAWKDSSLFVADTENHSIRRIDLAAKSVTTVAGNGRQGPWMSRGGKGLETSLSSPWDIAASQDILFIAMAGNHQIWKFDTRTGMVLPFAGSGYENIVDGHRSVAQLAQPSGISISGEKMYFTDSETSSVRELDLKTNQVKTLVGRGLFVFGYNDGNLDESLFQHPLGVCASPKGVYVSDTYNSALREINLEDHKVSTIIGGGEISGICKLGDPRCDTLGLYEPSDVKMYQDKLYIADTNNHLIRLYDLKANTLKTLEIVS